MFTFRHARWRVIMVAIALTVAMGVVPQFVHSNQVLAQRSDAPAAAQQASSSNSMMLQVTATGTASPTATATATPLPTATATATARPITTPFVAPSSFSPVPGPTTTGFGIIQCPAANGIASGPVTLTIGSSPTGSAAAIPALSCQAVTGQLAAINAANASVAICGTVSAYTAPTSSSAGSLTVNGLLIPIPAGYTPPGYLAVGATVYVVFLSPGGQLIEISPGFCSVPLSATAVRLGGAFRSGRTFSG